MKLLHYVAQQWRSIHGGVAEQRGLREVAEANSARPSHKDWDNVPGIDLLSQGRDHPGQPSLTRAQWTLVASWSTF